MTSNYYKLVAWFEELDDEEIEVYNEMSCLENYISLADSIFFDYLRQIPIENMFNLTFDENRAWLDIIQDKFYR